PARPDLDRLVATAGLDLRWDPVVGAYLAPPTVDRTDSADSVLTRHTTAVPTTSITPLEIDVASDFEARLRRSMDNGGLLVLVAEPKRLESSATELARLPLTIVDFDDWLVAALKRLTETGRPSWELVVDVDAAGPASARWQNLARVVDRALDSV